MPGLPPQFTSSALPVQPPAPNYSISVISTQHALPPVSTADSIFRYAAAVQQLCSRKAELCECASPARGNAAWWYMVCSCSTLVTCLAGRGPAIGHSNSWGPVGATGLQEQQAAAHRPPSSADSSLQCATHTRTTVEQATDYEHCHPRLPCISLARLGSVHSAQQHVHTAVAAVADTSKPTSEGSDSVRRLLVQLRPAVTAPLCQLWAGCTACGALHAVEGYDDAHGRMAAIQHVGGRPLAYSVCCFTFSATWQCYESPT